MKRLVAVAALILCATAAPASAVPIFYDDFQSNSPGNLGLNTVPFGWSVANGTVDVLAFPSCAGSLSGGVCVDLDGSSGNAGDLNKSLNLTAGLYVLEFYLRGNDRGGPLDTVQVYWQNALVASISLLSAAPWASYSYSVAAATTDSYGLMFQNLGGDNIGIWLDDVSISAAVPEPTSMMLLGTGLAGLFVRARRRRAHRAGHIA